MKKIFFWIYLFPTFILLTQAQAQVQTQDQYLFLNQGWSVQETQKAFDWNLGTELMPARWFMALEKHDSNQKFSDGLDRFGFILRSGTLPVGVTIDENELTTHLYNERKWVGVNCAACHTSALQVKGKTLLVNGNQSQLRLQEFEESIIKSVEATLTDSAKMARFMRQLSEKNVSDLTARLRLFYKEFKQVNESNRHYFDSQNQDVRWGPGRIDGLGGSTNDLSCRLTPRMGSAFLTSLFINEKNCGPSHAPTSIPHLWGMTNQNFVQWNAQVHATLGRNVGALMAGYGKNWVQTTLIGAPKVMTTVKIGEVYKVEDLYKKLKAPIWQDFVDHNLAENLDQMKIAQGQKLFIQNCQSCHAVQPKLTQPNKYGNRYWDYPVISMNEIGTDPFYIRDELKRKTYVNAIIAPLYLAIFGFDNITLNGQVPAQAARGIVPAAAIVNYFRENAISLKEIDRMNNCREGTQSGQISGIKSKSLEGILFTAPYLHNGSVPTIYDLLERPELRPTKFLVGCKNYDLDKFGYVCDTNDLNTAEFDTTRQGNGNQGHVYGTELSHTEKTDLVEFIKSLQQPEYVAGNKTCN